MKPLLLDGCACQGAAGYGYNLAGFDTVGFDINAQPNHRGEFRQADFLDVLEDLARQAEMGERPTFEGREVAAVHMSWPCQAFTVTQRIRNNVHPDLITPGRALALRTGLPYIIENVVGAPLVDPVELCGCMFDGLGVYRPRLFETSFPVVQPPHRPHLEPQTKMGRAPKPGHRMHVVGNFSGVAAARAAMGISWMTRDGLREAIPPAYTQFIGEQLLAQVRQLVLAA